MRWLKVLRETPRWVLIATVIALIVMIYLGIINNYIKFSAMSQTASADVQYPTIRNNLSPAKPAETETTVSRVAGAIICVILGFICLLLGITRSINKLDGKTSYLMAAFLVLFTLNLLSSIDTIAAFFKPTPLFIIRWVSFFVYPFPFFLYIYYNMRPSFYKWTWPLFFLPVANTIATWAAHLTVDFPFEIANPWHSAFAVSCFIVLLAFGFFGAVEKSSIWFTRIISLQWLFWLFSAGIRVMLGYQYRQIIEVIINMIISAFVAVCYLVFTGSRELFTYKSHTHMLETKNGLLLESYQNIESYINQIAFMKHEMRNHLIAIKMLLDDGDNDRLIKCLTGIQDSYLMPDEPVFCGHRLIQSILGHTRARAHQIDIKISFEVAALPPVSLADADAVSLLMNLLNNALESCENIASPEKRWINVNIHCRAPYLYISVKNALNHDILTGNGKLTTTKTDSAFHGYGISIVNDVVKRYDGIATFEYNGDTFIAEVALPVVE
jgi:hypothetical protein